MHTRARGDRYETQAQRYLIDKGFIVVTANYTSRFGEIDIIATKNGVYHFVEVKGGEGFEPVYNITPAKIKKITKTAYSYLKQHALDVAFCIDAIIIQDETLEYLPNITL